MRNLPTPLISVIGARPLVVAMTLFATTVAPVAMAQSKEFNRPITDSSAKSLIRDIRPFQQKKDVHPIDLIYCVKASTCLARQRPVSPEGKDALVALAQLSPNYMSRIAGLHALPDLELPAPELAFLYRQALQDTMIMVRYNALTAIARSDGYKDVLRTELFIALREQYSRDSTQAMTNRLVAAFILEGRSKHDSIPDVSRPTQQKAGHLKSLLTSEDTSIAHKALREYLAGRQAIPGIIGNLINGRMAISKSSGANEDDYYVGDPVDSHRRTETDGASHSKPDWGNNPLTDKAPPVRGGWTMPKGVPTYMGYLSTLAALDNVAIKHFITQLDDNSTSNILLAVQCLGQIGYVASDAIPTLRRVRGQTNDAELIRSIDGALLKIER